MQKRGVKVRKESTVKNVLVLAVVFILLASLFVCPSCGTPISVGDNRGKPAVSAQEAKTTQTISLPFGRHKEKNILGDFIYGTNGWHSDITYNTLSCEYIFMFQEGYEGFYLATRRSRGGVMKLVIMIPAPSSAPVFYSEEGKMSNIREELEDALSKERAKKITFEDYVFYSLDELKLFSEDREKYENFCGMNLFNWWLEIYQDSLITQDIKDGKGYPTQWIRDTVDVKRIKESTEIDFNHPFWDEVNFGSKFRSYRDDGTYVVLKPTRGIENNEGPPENTFTIDDELFATKKSVEEHLEKEGYESISTALAKENFEKLTEEEEKYLMVFYR